MTEAGPAPRSLRALPKVHVHVHLDGSYPLAAVQELARRRGLSFAVPERFDDVWQFFDAYGTVPDLVEGHEDLAALCRALVLAEAAQGVVYLEPAIEAQLYAERLGGIRQVTATMVRALAEGAAEADIEVGANLTINTDQDLPIAGELARVAADYAGRGVTALGTAGFEEPAGLGRFAAAAAVARSAGLPIVAHAGQTGGPDSVLEALDELGATRVSHGVNSVRSPELLGRLAAEQIVCDVCPVSNVRLGVVASLAEHPAPDLLEAGVAITLNADDELWFGASVTDQYEIARRQWGLSDVAIAAIARNGALIAGMSADNRRGFLADIDEWMVGLRV